MEYVKDCCATRTGKQCRFCEINPWKGKMFMGIPVTPNFPCSNTKTFLKQHCTKMKPIKSFVQWMTSSQELN